MANPELWEVAKKNRGQPPKFNNPEQMIESANEYFEWCKQNPLIETKAFCSNGEVTYADIPRMRAMTQDGLCVFLNISVSTWHNYKNNSEYLEVTKYIESFMREQKFSGAAGGMLNANIIARDLGLKEKVESENTHKIEKADDSEW